MNAVYTFAHGRFNAMANRELNQISDLRHQWVSSLRQPFASLSPAMPGKLLLPHPPVYFKIKEQTIKKL